MSKNSRLRLSREKSGLSQQELADKMPVNSKGNRVTQSYIAQLEKDKGYSLKQAKEFARILNTSAEWLYFGNNIVTNGNNSRGGIESLSDMEDINQSATGFKYPYANKPKNGIMQIIQNIESLQMMQNQQIELLKKHVFESMPKS